MHTHVQGVYIYLLLQRKLAEIVYIYKPCLCLHVYTMYRGTTKLRNENETKRNETKWSITKRNEIYQTKHKRSKNNQWRGKIQRNIEWLVRLFIDLRWDAFLLQNWKRLTKVMHQYIKFLKHRVSFRNRLWPASKGLLNVSKWTSKPGFKELVLLKCWYK
jgi:hypothetical protein